MNNYSRVAITYEQAIKIDELLEIIIKLSSNEVLRKFRVEKLLNQLDYNYSELKYYIDQLIINIQYHEQPVIDYDESGNEYTFISENFLTKLFIEQGGCVQWRINQLEIEDKNREREDLKLKKLKAELKEFRLKKWQFWLTFGIAVVGLILSIINLITKTVS